MDKANYLATMNGKRIKAAPPRLNRPNEWSAIKAELHKLFEARLPMLLEVKRVAAEPSRDRDFSPTVPHQDVA